MQVNVIVQLVRRLKIVIAINVEGRRTRDSMEALDGEFLDRLMNIQASTVLVCLTD